MPRTSLGFLVAAGRIGEGDRDQVLISPPGQGLWLGGSAVGSKLAPLSLFSCR